LTLRAGGQRQHTPTLGQSTCHAQTHIAAAHDQQAFATKARRQRAQRTLV
jgi:hypothetical protein